MKSLTDILYTTVLGASLLSTGCSKYGHIQGHVNELSTIYDADQRTKEFRVTLKEGGCAVRYSRGDDSYNNNPNFWMEDQHTRLQQAKEKNVAVIIGGTTLDSKCLDLVGVRELDSKK